MDDSVKTKNVDQPLGRDLGQNEHLASRDAREQLLDCWPILVDLERGHIRFGTRGERHLWKNPST
ncbi:MULTISPECIES: hypothetical protein [unclassified Streptomyces]|uniref:hypothetical protein n=1 Tax=unclassified Streptomyces TaxID=2593676 RepID=UPI0036F00C57